MAGFAAFLSGFAGSLGQSMQDQQKREEAKAMQEDAEKRFQARLKFESDQRMKEQQRETALKPPVENETVSRDESGNQLSQRRRWTPDFEAPEKSHYENVGEPTKVAPKYGFKTAGGGLYRTTDAGSAELIPGSEKKAGLAGGVGKAPKPNFKEVMGDDGPMLVDVNSQPVNPDTKKPWHTPGSKASNTGNVRLETDAWMKRFKDDQWSDSDIADALRQRGMEPTQTKVETHWYGDTPAADKPNNIDKAKLAKALAMDALGLDKPVAGLSKGADISAKAEAPKKAAVKDMPVGMRLVGYSKGKPVYENAKGERFTDD